MENLKQIITKTITETNFIADELARDVGGPSTFIRTLKQQNKLMAASLEDSNIEDTVMNTWLYELRNSMACLRRGKDADIGACDMILARLDKIEEKYKTVPKTKDKLKDALSETRGIATRIANLTKAVENKHGLCEQTSKTMNINIRTEEYVAAILDVYEDLDEQTVMKIVYEKNKPYVWANATQPGLMSLNDKRLIDEAICAKFMGQIKSVVETFDSMKPKLKNSPAQKPGVKGKETKPNDR